MHLALAFALLLLCNAQCSAHPQSPSYLSGRLCASDKRYTTFLKALDLLEKRSASTLVETGTARYGAMEFAGDGGSTIIFSHWAKDHEAAFYSVDIDPSSIKCARSAIDFSKQSVELIESDSIEYLVHFTKPIDFLYLDSFDFDCDDPLPSQLHHLCEIIAAYPHLHDNSVVMIDDCDLPSGGKGKYVIEFLKTRGWKIVGNDYQVILVKGRSLEM